MIRWLLALVGLVLLAAVGTFVLASRGVPMSVEITKPDRVVVQAGTLDVLVAAPEARLDSLSITLEQNGKTVPLFSLDQPTSGSIAQVDAEHMRVSRPLGKQSVPELQSGPARIVVTASRKGFLSLRTFTTTARRDVQVRLDPPRVAVLSTHHYLNHGGAEMVVYRATPPDVVSGVRVGDIEYLGYPAAGAGVAGADDSTKMAFFALLHDQDLNAPVVAFARDDAGNEAHVSFVEKVFPKPFRRSKINIDDRFLQRVVPEILSHAPELQVQAASADLVNDFVKINSDLRRLNSERIVEVTKSTAPTRLWTGQFLPLGNAQVEASFADHRTYFYQAKEIDQQVHLGFDLAVTSATPVAAENAGKVLLAEWLGIYGNCVILDHGMGVASLYAHLSVVDVKVGDAVSKGQVLGRSGMTGLAAGDHLHFTMLVGGRPVNPVEWWDPHWIRDRIDRKLDPSGSAPAPGRPTPGVS
jgi:murein DD-endopeptidase MepM/ murein hydrolase activator NlpD